MYLDPFLDITTYHLNPTRSLLSTTSQRIQHENRTSPSSRLNLDSYGGPVVLRG